MLAARKIRIRRTRGGSRSRSKTRALRRKKKHDYGALIK